MFYIICNLIILFLIILSHLYIIKLSLYFTTGFKYKYNILILPSIISSTFWFIILFIFKLIIKDILKIDLFYILYNNCIHSIGPLFLIFIGFCIFGIFTQAMSYMTINFIRKDSFGNAHLTIMNIIKREEKNIPHNEHDSSITNYINIPTINFSTAMTASLYTFISLIFIIFFLFFLGIIFGKKLAFIF